MENLAEKMRFGYQKPQNGEKYHEFWVDKTSTTTMYDIFCSFFVELNISVDEVSNEEFTECVHIFADYYNTVRERLIMLQINKEARYFWIAK